MPDRRRRACPLAIAVALSVLASASTAGAQSTDELSYRLDALTGKDLRSASAAEQNEAVSLPPRGPGSLLRDGGSLLADVRVTGDPRERLDAVRATGADVVGVSPQYRNITVAVQERDMHDLANTPGVEAVTEILTPASGGIAAEAEPAEGATGAINTCATGTVSEGNTQLKAGAARTQFDVDGTGVKVGVISDSYNRKVTGTLAPADVASGDLPGPGNPCGRTTPVNVLSEGTAPSPTPIDEGRALAQVVHDIAPGATLSFATSLPGDFEFADNLRALANSGVDVIADDYIYFREPFFQDGNVAVAVNDATAQGVAYFSMAFNSNRIIAGNDSNSWEAPAYRDTACPPEVTGTSCMDFDPGGGTDSTFGITVPSGKTPRIDLQWAEPWFGVSTDFDLFLVNEVTNTVQGQSLSVNATTQTPFEFSFINSTNDTSLNYSIVIRRTSGTGTPRMKWVNVDNTADAISALEYPVSAGGDIVGPTIFGHNGTANAETVGAVPFNNSGIVEAYSARGPVTHYFGPVNGTTPAAALDSPEVLSKPDIAATDGGQNTFFGTFTGGVFRFFGTSASAPHAAGVAALQLEANPALSSTQVKNTLEATADPVGAATPLQVGAGLIDAQAAVAANPPAAPTVSASAPALTNDSTPAIMFTTTGDLSSQTCSIDGGAAQPCSGTFSPAAALPDGQHTLAVNVTDFFAQSGSGSTSFGTDTKAPGAEIKKGPKKTTTKTKAKFALSADAGAELECKLDKEGFEGCSAKAKFKVKPGKHKLLVHATDPAGNVSKDLVYKWKVLEKKK